MGFTVKTAGILTTIQDNGRFGYEKFGISPSGPMDFVSFTLANILVGNSWGDSALEATLLGPSIVFDDECIIAITGADMTPMINNAHCEMYRALSVKSGDVLNLGNSPARTNCRAYIAFHGGLEVQRVMGSAATAIQNRIGSRLHKSDYIRIHKSITPVRNLQSRFIVPPESLSGEKIIRVILGPQDHAFTDEGLANFLNTPYTVTSDFDRMGYRLTGKNISHKTDCNIISDGIVNGAIQVPGSGQPIIMTAERQTIGGYTKIAAVISADLPVIGQSRAGDILRFKAISVREAHEILREVNNNLMAIQERLDSARVTSYRVKVDGKIYHVSVEHL